MAVRVQHSQTIDRPVAAVFDFMARNHIRNHPRWDPSMEVVQFEPNRAAGTVIKDGPIEMRGRISFAAAGPDRTIVTRSAEFPGVEAPVDTAVIQALLEQTGRILQELLESEL